MKNVLPAKHFFLRFQIKEINWFNDKEMLVCHIPFLFLPVPLLT